MTRTVVVWCPDWPVQASGVDPGSFVAVLHANRVVACSAPARREGVRVNQRRRQAEAACPGLTVVNADPDRDARAFEPVVATVAGYCPLVEVVRPGLAAFAARGPARVFGGEARLLSLLTSSLPTSRIGVADSLFSATLAARQGLVVPAGQTPAFLVPRDVHELELAGLDDAPELTSLLDRLGIRTLGQFASLPAAQVMARFGPVGLAAHRAARGLDLRPLDARRPPEDLSVRAELEPPVERVDTAAFTAKALSDQLFDALAERALRCTLVRIEAETEHGESLSRVWRHDGTFTPSALAERVRWQLDGWISGASGTQRGVPRPTGGISLLRLVPEEVVADQGSQRGFWGGSAEADQRAGRVLARAQALLGPDGVVVAVLQGGRSAAERVRAVPWGDEREPLRRNEEPWPGRVPAPAPAPVAGGGAELLDAAGTPVRVDAGGELSSAPAGLDGAAVTAWSTPWPVHERWWDPEACRRRARLQIVTADGQAFLLAVEGGRWSIEGAYA